MLFHLQISSMLLAKHKLNSMTENMEYFHFLRTYQCPYRPVLLHLFLQYGYEKQKDNPVYDLIAFPLTPLAKYISFKSIGIAPIELIQSTHSLI